MSLLSSLLPIIERSQKRVGRGYGSGKGGHTSGRGMKGQNSRNGGKRPLWFEGGQLPLIKRIPMWRGKSRLESVTNSAAVSLTELSNMKSTEITLETLKLEKVISTKTRVVRVVAKGRIDRVIAVRGLKLSEKSRTLIEKAGGSVVD